MSELSPIELAERVGDLVRIPSVNPGQAGPMSGDDGERPLGAWMAERCDGLGAEVVVDDIDEGRCNVYARFEGTTDRVVTVDVHLDTVGVEHMEGDPFSGHVADDRVYGRGSVDTKATLALALAALEEMRADGTRPTPTVNVVGTISEEMGGLLGAEGYRDWLLDRGQRIDQMIVAEPTMCAPVHGHKGGFGLEVLIHGHAAHSSKPHLGKNAVSAAARVIVAVDSDQARLAELEPPTPVGNGTVSCTEIGGGLARNIIPDSCALYVGRRVAPGEDAWSEVERLKGLVSKAAAPLETTFELVNGSASDAFFTDPDSSIVRALAALSGTDPETAEYGTNALRYPEVATDIVVFGPGSIDQAHQAVEWVDIAELARAAETYRRLFRS